MKVGILIKKNLSPFEINVVNYILSSDRINVCLAVVDIRKQKSLKKKLITNLKKGRGGYVLVMALKKVFSPADNLVTATSYFEKHNIPVLFSENLYSQETISFIKHKSPDILLLVDAFGIIKNPILSIAPKGVFSFHHGDIRKYRGMPPAFWELYNGEKEMGITVQRLNERLDSGVPVIEKKVEIKPNDSLKTLTQRVFSESEPMMMQAVESVVSNNFSSHPVETLGKIYTLPNLTQWIIFNFKIRYRKIISRF